MLSEPAAGKALFRPEEARDYAPAGLDKGANALAEIAVSIVAVMRAVLGGRRGGRLPEAARILQGGLTGSDTNVLARAAEALTHGYTTAFLAGGGMLLA